MALDDKPVYLEHSKERVIRSHGPTECMREFCTLHNMSNHSMRSFPQHFRSDIGIMERICDHGVGHPDPDDPFAHPAHGCDGCCN